MTKGPRISPDDLTSGARRRLANETVKELPVASRAQIEPKLHAIFAGADADDELVRFLQGDEGRLLWEAMKLEDTEHTWKTLRERLGFHESSEARKSDAKSPLGQNSPLKGAQGTRLNIAIVLLVLGFALIYFTYLNIATISADFQKKRAEMFKDDKVASISADVSTLRQTVSDLGNHTLNIQSSLTKTTDSLTKLTNLTESLQSVASTALPSQRILGDQATAVTTANGNVEAALKPLVESSTPPPANGKDAPKPSPSVLELVKAASDRLAGSALPEDVTKTTDAVLKGLPNLRSLPDTAVADLRTVLNGEVVPDSNGQSWLYLGPKGRDALNRLRGASVPVLGFDYAVLAVGSSLQAMKPDIEKLREGLGKLTKVDLKAEEKDAIRKLAAQTQNVQESSAALKTQAKQLTDVGTALKTSIDALKGDLISAPLTDMGKTLQPLKDMTGVFSTASNAYKTSADTLNRLDEASKSVASIADLQAQLAYKGSSPAIWLLLAIGGMFVTFGLSSLLRWIKVMDQDRAYEIWDRRINQNLRVVAALLAHGNDPVEILRRLQNTPMPEDVGKNRPVETPLSVTLPELLNMLKGTK